MIALAFFQTHFCCHPGLTPWIVVDHSGEYVSVVSAPRIAAAGILGSMTSILSIATSSSGISYYKQARPCLTTTPVISTPSGYSVGSNCSKLLQMAQILALNDLFTAADLHPGSGTSGTHINSKRTHRDGDVSNIRHKDFSPLSFCP